MTHAEVAGCIQIKIFHNEGKINSWLQENADIEIVDIKFSSTVESDDVLIVYRKDE